MSDFIRPDQPEEPERTGAKVIDIIKRTPIPTDPAPADSTDEEEDEPTAVVPVDTPGLPVPGISQDRRRPVIPDWLRSKTGFLATANRAAGNALYAAAFHGVRTPWYALQLGVYAPRGAARFVRDTNRWVWDAEGQPLRSAAAFRENVDEYLKLSRQRDRRVRLRSLIAAVSGVFGLGFALTLLVMAPNWLYVFAGAGVLALGFLGAERDNPVIGPAVVRTEVQKLTSHMVIAALASIGIEKLTKAGKEGEGISFPAPITRDGPGYRADVDLPLGVTAADVMDRRKALASGLRRKLGCVWPEPDPDEHEGRMILWVGDKPINEVPAPKWPLLRSGSASLFKPLPFGTDQRMRPVNVDLMYDNVLIGAMPGMGKTFALRILLLAAALDVTAELLVWELKGTGDLSPLEKVAADYGSGPDDATKKAAIESIRYVHKDLERRAAVIQGLPKSVCPENKVTSALAARKELGLHPLLLAVDECQELFADETYGKEAGKLITAIIKRGRALGVIVLLATQRPDRDSLPKGISANVGIRFCLRMTGQVENDMVLGTSAYRNGIRATTFTKKDLGIGYLAGHAPDPQIARGYYVDNPTAEAICERARAARAAAGRLTGYAAGETPERDSGAETLLQDVLAVVPASEAKVWNETVVTRLADLRPNVYGGWEGEQLTSALKPYGIETVQVGRREGGKVVNRRGIERARITAALAERDS